MLLEQTTLNGSGGPWVSGTISTPSAATQTAAAPLTDAPTPVREAQLRELHIRVRQQNPAS